MDQVYRIRDYTAKTLTYCSSVLWHFFDRFESNEPEAKVNDEIVFLGYSMDIEQYHSILMLTVFTWSNIFLIYTGVYPLGFFITLVALWFFCGCNEDLSPALIEYVRNHPTYGRNVELFIDAFEDRLIIIRRWANSSCVPAAEQLKVLSKHAYFIVLALIASFFLRIGQVFGFGWVAYVLSIMFCLLPQVNRFVKCVAGATKSAIEDIKSRSNSFDADDEAVQAVKSALDEKEVLPVLINDSEEQEFKDVESYEPYVNANLSHFATPSHEEFDDHDFELISDEELKNAVEEMQKQADLLRAQAAESSSRPLLPTISFEEESRPNEPSAPPEPIEASAPPQNLLTDDDLLAMCPETPI